MTHILEDLIDSFAPQDVEIHPTLHFVSDVGLLALSAKKLGKFIIVNPNSASETRAISFFTRNPLD